MLARYALKQVSTKQGDFGGSIWRVGYPRENTLPPIRVYSVVLLNSKLDFAQQFGKTDQSCQIRCQLCIASQISSPYSYTHGFWLNFWDVFYVVGL